MARKESKYKPHQGKKEIAKRLKRIREGKLKPNPAKLLHYSP